MPELPEVETTASILNRLIVGKKITDVWTDYKSPYFKGKANIKDPRFFTLFKKEITGKKILRVFRRAKNVLLDIEGDKTILIHMKMTGHLLVGKYTFYKKENKWLADQKETSLRDPFNRFVHLVFTLNNGKHLAFSDMRKFATISLMKDKVAFNKYSESLGPEPLQKDFTWAILQKQLNKKPNGNIKTVLMNNEIIAGIGNIYSDEILWNANIHPERKVSQLHTEDFKNLCKWIKILLKKGITLGGDSMSDYRNPYGEKGRFHHTHNAYRKTNTKCNKKDCVGIIKRKIVNTRSAHFCPEHQN